MARAKRNLPVIVILLALLLIIFVIWFYNKRIESMDRKTMPVITKTNDLDVPLPKQLQLTIVSHF